MLSKPKIYSHRGITSFFPENSRPALEEALKLDINGAEFDVELTMDPVSVLIHQETFLANADLSRISPKKSFVKNYWIANYTLRELENLDCGSWFSDEFKDCRLITLKEALSLDWNGKSALIELKDIMHQDSKVRLPYHDAIVSAVSGMVRDFHNAGNSAFILSFSPEVLKAAFEQLPEVPRVQSAASFADLKARVDEARIPLHSFCTSETVLLNYPESVNMVHDKGCEIIVYEHINYGNKKPREECIQDRASIWEKFISLKVDGIITNYAEAFK